MKSFTPPPLSPAQRRHIVKLAQWAVSCGLTGDIDAERAAMLAFFQAAGYQAKVLADRRCPGLHRRASVLPELRIHHPNPTSRYNLGWGWMAVNRSSVRIWAEHKPACTDRRVSSPGK